MPHDRLHDALDEHRRDRHAAAAHQREVVRLERAGRKQRIAEGDEHFVVGARVGVAHGVELVLRDRARR